VLVVAIGLLAVGAAVAGPKRSIAVSGTSTAEGIVTVNVKITGWKMYPALVGKKSKSKDGGHWHIYVDGKYNGFSAHARIGQTTKLADGTHALYVELANNDHSSLKPRVRSGTVAVTITASTSEGGGGGGGGYDDPYGP
jgi:hypothetical protein